MLTPVFLILHATCATGPPQFEVRTMDGKPLAEAIEALADGRVTVAGGTTVAAGDWYLIRRSPGALPPWPDGPHLELTNGDRIRGEVIDSDGNTLRLRVAIPGAPDQTLRFPLSVLRSASVIGRADDAEPAWRTGGRKRDVIETRSGDVSVGAISSIDVAKNMLRLQVDGRDQQLEWRKVAAIGFNTDLARVRRPKGPYYRVTLLNGSRLSVNAISFDGRTWTAETLFKEAVKIPTDQLVSVDLEQGKPAYLSDLKPTSYRYQSFDGEQFALAENRNVIGRPIRLHAGDAESTFDRGIGLHAECTVAYSLGGKYRRFEALAGLDARSGRLGDAVVGVAVDGKDAELPRRGKLTFAGGPIVIQIDVTGAKELTITVDRGNGGNVQDHVNLTEARLVP